jgi:Fe-S cluster biogenesis protein NfuA
MSSCKNVFAVLTLVLASLIAAPGATAGGANQVVLSSTTSDSAWHVRASTQVVPVSGDTVTSANIASASASTCTGCHSTAVAVQVLIATRNPSYFAPANVASAVNGACDGCGSYAYAWQYIVQTGGPVHLSLAARERVESLRQQIADAAASMLPSDALTDRCIVPDGPPYPCATRDDQLTAMLDSLTAELKDAVDSGLVAPPGKIAGATNRQVRTSA